jgi:hypothetical protein
MYVCITESKLLYMVCSMESDIIVFLYFVTLLYQTKGGEGIEVRNYSS